MPLPTITGVDHPTENYIQSVYAVVNGPLFGPNGPGGALRVRCTLMSDRVN